MKLQKENIPFTMVANEVLNDRRISFKAKGIFSYLFSKPDGWNFSTIRIADDSTDEKHAVSSGLQELEQHGYLDRKRQPDGRVKYELKYGTQNLKTSFGLFDDPKPDFPTVGKSHCGKIRQVSKKDNTDKERGKSNTESGGAAAEAFSLKDEIDRLYENPRREMNVIALYLEERRPDIQTHEQLHVAIRRHVRAAKELSSFTDDQILNAIPKAKKVTEGWVLETLIKILTK